ncbi:hypothetical protein E2C01_043132 [Portunus trituberculatus]|uniref:Secreted peptide n=1 Tax=Portunus trituberculatus TaxID=210409 RepID=A0A5B7FWG0_PORTR|nr:hypothetical protein [Portunus trituberculatus]
MVVVVVVVSVAASALLSSTCTISRYSPTMAVTTIIDQIETQCGGQVTVIAAAACTSAPLPLCLSALHIHRKLTPCRERRCTFLSYVEAIP